MLCIQAPSSCRLGLSSSTHRPSSSTFRICCRTASTMGITIITAEVFWTHMERKAQPDMKPNINLETTTWRSESSLQLEHLLGGGGGGCSPRRVDSHHGDQPQCDPAVETPLLDGGSQADDAHQQEVEVLKILLRHLEDGQRNNTTGSVVFYAGED